MDSGSHFERGTNGNDCSPRKEGTRSDWECYRTTACFIPTDRATPVTTCPNSPSVSGPSRSSWPGRLDKGELETSWFERHGSTPITEIPTHWPAASSARLDAQSPHSPTHCPDAYRDRVEQRIRLIETNKEIGLIERTVQAPLE